MRKKIINVLRKMEKDESFVNEYEEALPGCGDQHFIKECVSFPTYKTIANKINEKYTRKTRSGLIFPISDGSVKAELKRMEMDELVIIGDQRGIQYIAGQGLYSCSPEMEATAIIESVILTTKGKSWWNYLLHQATENPFNLIAIIISISGIIWHKLAVFIRLLFSIIN